MTSRKQRRPYESIFGFFYFIDRAIIETHCRFLGAIRVDTGRLARLGDCGEQTSLQAIRITADKTTYQK
jgi:hypothetical protein